jgi:hypothetical protein
MPLSFSDMFNPFNFKGNKPTNLKFFSMESFLIALGGPFGQLYMRIVHFNGSLDKLWLLLFPLFAIPPFSAIPLFWAIRGWIKKIDSNTIQMLDYGVLLPILCKLLLPFIIVDETMFGFMGQGITILFIVFTMLFINLWNKQKLVKASKCTDVKITSVVGRSIGESLIQFSLATLPIYLLGLVPIAGEVMDGITMLPLIGDMVKSGIWIGGYIMGYVLTNMIGANFLWKPCDPSYIIIGIVGFFAFILSGFFEFADLIPGLNLLF